MTKLTRKYGPFTWERNDNGSDECWDMVKIPNLPTTFWYIENYGGTPGPGFAGWKIGSGGPFDCFGAYSSLEEALKGATPLLIKRMRNDVREEVRKALRTKRAADKFLGTLARATA